MGRALVLWLTLLAPWTARAGAESALVLRWEAVPGAEEYLLEIAEDRSFERIIERKRVPHAAYRFLAPSTDVSYFFRVAAVDKLGRTGRFSRAKAIQQVLPTPTLIGPAEGAQVNHAGPPPTVTLQWKAVEDAASYRVAIDTESGFSGASPTKVTTTAYTWKPPELGIYYWRVAAVDKSGLAGRYTKARRFDVRTGPPRLRKPRSGAMVAFEQPSTKITLVWSSGPAKQFDIELDNTSRFTKPRKLTSKNGKYTLKLSEPGTTHWRVRAIEPDGTTGPWSTPASFALRTASIELVSPDAGAAVTAPESSAPVTFAWKPIDGAHSYTVTLVTSAGDDERIETREPSTTAKLPPETYTWSVSAFDRRRRLVEFSVERSMTVARRLPAPTVVAPEADSSFVLLAPGNPEIELTWQPIADANSYEVEVGDSAALEDSERKDAAAPRATLWVARPGDTYWRVRATNGEWSEARKLSITPRAQRAEMTSRSGSDGEEIVVTVVDEAGAGVAGVPLTGSATAGALTSFADQGDGSYVATWSGDDSATVSATGPFDLHASTVIGSKATLWAGAEVGVLTNFGADASPRFHLRARYHLPWLQQRLFATAAFGYAYSGKSFEDVVSVAAVLHRFPITVGAGYRHPLPWLEVYGTIGLALDPFVGTVSVDEAPFDDEPGILVGADIAAGACYDLGPGRLHAELALRASSSWDGLFSLGGVGMVVAVGYSFGIL